MKFIDYAIIILFFVFYLIVGILLKKRAEKNSTEYFLSGKSMPWWLLGVSMVATTFSTDTPNLVTDIVRNNGVSGNWVWFAFLITGMVTVFIYANLWKRSEVFTDLEFYELRYSGKAAAFLRGFRALYIGVFFNIMIMAAVSLAAIKIGGVLLNISPLETMLYAGIIVMIYSSLGGLRGILFADFFQFFVAMAGSLAVAYYSVNHKSIGGLSNLLKNKEVLSKLSIFPNFNDTSTLIAVFIIPLAVQWWAAWYPGAEPGGGGYIVQRMLAAKDEKNAVGATLLFNITHYAIRPWPWIIVALSSIVVFPTLDSLRTAFPNVSSSIINHDMAYPAMISFLPTGIMGIVIASLIAAYMSTISTHLNWGASYIVNDFYKRFVKPNASESELVKVGRISTIGLMVVSGLIALVLSNALQAFYILLQIGAGTGLIFLLRWFWWRINAISEIVAMVVSFIVAVFFTVYQKLGFTKLPQWEELIIGVIITTISWIISVFLTTPTDEDKLISFIQKVNPCDFGWKSFIRKVESKGVSIRYERQGNFGSKLLNIFSGTVFVYSFLFSIGFLFEGKISFFYISLLLIIISSVILIKSIRKIFK